jgi:cell wall-associated NlpC family hydrolase
MNHLTTDTIYVGQTLHVRSARTNPAITKVSAASTHIGKQTIAKSYSKAVEKSVGTSNSTAIQKPVATTNSIAAQKPAVTTNSTVAEKPAVTTNSTVAQKQVATTNSTVVQKQVATTNSTVAEKPAVTSNSTVTEKPAVTSNSTVTEKPAETSASKVQAIIDEAKKYIGTPYSWGGNTPAGFDCSGFTKYVFNKVGISLPRTTAAQWDATTPVNSPSIGDLVFFETYKKGPSHVGIYLGNSKFISAASSGVTISDMTSTYWKTRYLGTRSAF